MQDYVMMFFSMGPLKIIGCVMFLGIIFLMVTYGKGGNNNNNNSNNNNTTNTNTNNTTNNTNTNINNTTNK